jgi:hypothetical protein
MFLYKLQHFKRMGSESVVIFIHKLGAENRPGVIFTHRFLYLQTKRPKCPLNRRLGGPRFDWDAFGEI